MNETIASAPLRRVLGLLLLWASSGAGLHAAVGELPGTDRELETAVADRLARDPALARLDLRVQARSGHVRLTGTVPTLAARREATRLVAGQRGVLELETHLALTDDDLSDRRLAMRVRDVLRFHRDLSPPLLTVSVADGIARTEGEVGTIGRFLFLRKRLESVEGLREIDLSRTTIETRSVARVDGDGLRDAVLALLKDREDFPISGALNVENRNGVIVLTGTVPRLIDKMEAMEVAALAADSTRLRDEIRLDPTHGRMRVHDGVPEERRRGPDTNGR